MAHDSRLRRWLPWFIAYAALVVAVVAAMFKTCDWAIEQLSSPKSLTDWQTWRNDVQQQQDQPSPVQRRVPKSKEPPELVIMRDHFAVSLFAAVLFSTMLYWVCAWFVMGVMKPAGPVATKKS